MVARLLSVVGLGIVLWSVLFADAAALQDGTRPLQPLVGLSVPSQTATIAPEQSGKIVAIPVAEGHPVREGQVVFELSSKLQKLEVERLRALAESDLISIRARTGLQHAEKQADRVKQLRAREITSDSDLQERMYEVQIARLRLDQAALEQAQATNEYEQAVEVLAQRTLRSPVSGIVTQRFKSVGETVEKFVPVLEVVDLDPLWVEFDCPVADEKLYALGTSITVSPAVRPDDKRTAEVVFTSMKASPSSHSFMVRAAVRNEDHSWKAGLKMLVHRPSGSPAGKPSGPGK